MKETSSGQRGKIEKCRARAHPPKLQTTTRAKQRLRTQQRASAPSRVEGKKASLREPLPQHTSRSPTRFACHAASRPCAAIYRSALQCRTNKHRPWLYLCAAQLVAAGRRSRRSSCTRRVWQRTGDEREEERALGGIRRCRRAHNGRRTACDGRLASLRGSTRGREQRRRINRSHLSGDI